MSFAVLGAISRRVIVTDKRCVEKTYPSFWDDIRQHLGITFRDLSSMPASKSDTFRHIVVIGMRGSGKSFIGSYAQSALPDYIDVVDLDSRIEEQLGMTIADYIYSPQGS